MASAFANYVFPQLDIREEAGLDGRRQAEGSVNERRVYVFVFLLFLGQISVILSEEVPLWLQCWGAVSGPLRQCRSTE